MLKPIIALAGAGLLTAACATSDHTAGTTVRAPRSAP
jgi:hypothetical protein